MKFHELTIRELRAQATSACIKAVRLLEGSQLRKFNNLTVDFIDPFGDEVDDYEDYRDFIALGTISLNDEPKIFFKAWLTWLGDGCDLSGPDSVEFIDVDINKLSLK